MIPLDGAHQTALQNSPWAGAIVLAIEAAGVPISYSQAGYEAGDAGIAQQIVDTEATWLPFAKQLRSAEVDGLLQGKIGSGFAYAGPDSVRRVFQIDDQSQFNITAQVVAAQIAGAAWPSGAYWIAADNSQMPLPTAASMVSFGQAASAYVSALILTRRAIKDAIASATSAAALAAIDITQGWPAVG